MGSTKRGILVVSFGTSYVETRKKTIDQIEADIQNRYPEYPVYRAWTSGMICRKILKRDGIRIMNVREALGQMLADGIREVAVQPTHVINGIENDTMTADVLAFSSSFDKIEIGTPLLTEQEDNIEVAKTLAESIQPGEDEALVFMGHGTEHYANSVYAAMDYLFKDMNYPNIYMGTVEAYPSVDTILTSLAKTPVKKVILAPFMIVAGDHANNDLCGDEEDSWKSRFEAAGYEVSCILKGLGEYPGIRSILLKHTEEAVKRL